MKYFTVLPFLFFYLSVSAQNIHQGLVLYYPFDGNTNDIGPLGLQGTTSGTFVSDRNGNLNSALQLDGIDDFVEIPYSNDYKVGFPATFSMVFKVNSFPSNHHTALFTNDHVEEIYSGLKVWVLVSGKLSVSIGNDGGISSSSRVGKDTDNPIQTGVWYQLVVVWNSTQDFKIYLDCVEEPGTYSGSASGIQYHSVGQVTGTIGKGDSNANNPSVTFDGVVDEVGFWNRALNIQEIAQLCGGLKLTTEEEVNHKFLNLYQNPADGNLVMQSQASSFRPLELIIFNVNGKQVYKEIIHHPYQVLKIQGLTQGLYVYQLKDGESQAPVVGKFILK